MECVRAIIEPKRLKGIIKIPEEMEKSNVEVIILPTGGGPGQSTLTDKLKAIEELDGLIADQSKEKLDEFDQVIIKMENWDHTDRR